MKSKSYAIFVTVLASLLWGSSFPINKVGVSYVDPYTFAFLRLIMASAAILLTAAAMRKLNLSIFKNKIVWGMGILNAGGFLLQYVGFVYTTASRSSLLVDSDVILIAVLSWRIFKERFSNEKKTAVVMGVLGAALLESGANLSSLLGGELMGDLLVFLSGVVWAFFMVANKGLITEKVDLVSLAVGVQITTTLVLFPFGVTLGTTNITTMAPEGWAAIIFTGVFCSTAAYLLWSKGLKGLTVTTSAIILLLEVLWALLLSFTLLGETFSIIAGLGASLILVSILLASK
jgi:drug/metabolite transporter (DMT)-like permease